MSLLREITSGLRSLLRKEEVHRELDEELRTYLEMAIDEKMKKGMSRIQAVRAVRLEQGNIEVTREIVHAAAWESVLETWWQDVRIGFRRLCKSPGFTAVVLLTLALGIGATTAIFTLINAVMLKSLPVANPGQLYRLGDNNNCCVMVGTQNDGSFVLYSYPLYEYLRDHTPEFTGLAAFSSHLSDLSLRRRSDSAAAQPYKGEFVSGNYFEMFGIGAFVGRTLMATDDMAGAPLVAVMSYHTWQTHYGSDPSVIGAAFTINTVPYTVVGVAPPRFYGDTLRSDPPDFWLPLAANPDRWLFGPEPEWLYLMGRLKTDFTSEQVQARLTVELQEWLGSHREVIPERDWKDIARQHIHLTPGGRGVEEMQTDYSLGLRLLVTLSLFLLLIACANVANLLLVRASAHRSQMAIRSALGAPRRRLIQQMLTESLLLAVAGGAVGLYVAYAGTHAILLLAFRGAHYIPIDARPSITVLGFAVLLSLGTGFGFGIAPAWLTSHSNPADALRGVGRSTSDRSSAVQMSLVIVQVTFSIVLLIGAGLVTQSLRHLEYQHFGFVTDGRLIVNIAPSLAGYTPDKLGGLYQRLEDALPQIPGILSASLSWYSPLGGDNANERVYIQGKPPDYRWSAPSWDRVGPRYFETIGTRLVRGRVIDEHDTPAARNVAVINETFARRFFMNEDPIGQHFGMADETHSSDYEIVGIVEDAKYQDTRGPAYATFFLPLLQTPPGEPVRGWVGAIELHVAGKPENIEPSVRQTLADVDPGLTVLNMVSFGEQVARNFNQERLIARLAGLFGVLALILACVGLYGITAYSVARRINEIGIRMALGANRSNILGLVLRSALLQLGIGLAIGVPVALAGGRVLAGQLYGVKSHDPSTLGLAVVMLAACALLAAFVPALRATKVDPLMALRYE
jgi:macrolide transport system ATP-binding/permease protein